MQRCFDIDKMFLQVNICRVLYGTCNDKKFLVDISTRAQLSRHCSTMFLQVSTYSLKNEIEWNVINRKKFTIATEPTRILSRRP